MEGGGENIQLRTDWLDMQFRWLTLWMLINVSFVGEQKAAASSNGLIVIAEAVAHQAK